MQRSAQTYVAHGHSAHVHSAQVHSAHVPGHLCEACGADVTQAHTSRFRLTGGDDEFHKCVPGMVCASWGAPMWYCMHMISRNYPEEPTVEQKQQYFEWLVSHRHTLPCCCCRSHFAQHLSTHGLHGPHVVPPSSKAEGWRVEPWNVFDNTGTFFNFLCTLHNNVNATLGRPKLTKDDFAQLYDFYGASQCATAENYGRAFVVVQPGPETTKVHDSILTHKKLVTQGCRLLGIVNAPQGTCLDATALPPRAAPALEPRAATTAGASAATAVEPSEAK